MALQWESCRVCDTKFWCSPERRAVEEPRCFTHRRGMKLVADVEREGRDGKRRGPRRARRLQAA